MERYLDDAEAPLFFAEVRIAYCTNVRLPSERAHGHQIAAVCDALVQLGHDVTVYAPYRDNVVKEQFADYYGISNRITLTHLGSFDSIKAPWLPGVLGLLWLNFFFRKHLRSALSASAFDALYTRAPALLPALLQVGSPVILELHQLPRRHRKLFVRQCNACALVACLTSPMRDELLSWGVDPKRVIVEGDAVDVDKFSALPSREEARGTLEIQTDRLVVGYVGRLKTLGMEKGVGILLEALQALQSTGQFFGLIVGGPEADQRAYEEQAKALGLTADDVQFTGAVPADEVPTALAACDILAMPFPDFPHYRTNMSPLKLFEYLATGRPIVSSDLPTVRDVISEENAFFCIPGSGESLAETLQDIHDHPEASATRAKAALALAPFHSWPNRMKRILDALPHA